MLENATLGNARWLLRTIISRAKASPQTIDIRRLEAGSIFLVETEKSYCLIEVVEPADALCCVVRVIKADPGQQESDFGSLGRVTVRGQTEVGKGLTFVSSQAPSKEMQTTLVQGFRFS